MHPIVRGIYFDLVPIYTGAKRLSRGTDLCDGKLLVNQTIPSGYLMEGTGGSIFIYLPVMSDPERNIPSFTFCTDLDTAREYGRQG